MYIVQVLWFWNIHMLRKLYICCFKINFCGKTTFVQPLRNISSVMIKGRFHEQTHNYILSNWRVIKNYCDFSLVAYLLLNYIKFWCLSLVAWVQQTVINCFFLLLFKRKITLFSRLPLLLALSIFAHALLRGKVWIKDWLLIGISLFVFVSC